MRRYLLLIAAIVCLPVMADQAGVAKLRELAAKQASAWTKLGDYRLVSSDSLTTTHQGDNLDITVVNDERHQGNSFWLLHKMVRNSSPGVSFPTGTEENTFAMNQNTACLHHVGGGADESHVWELRGRKDFPVMVVEMRDHLINAPMSRFAFGNGDVTFSELLAQCEQNPTAMDISTSDPNPSDSFITITVSKQWNGVSKKQMELTVDEAKGSLITESQLYMPDGLVLREVKVSAKEYQPGLWFPSSWAVREFDVRGLQPGETAPVTRNLLVTVTELTPQATFGDDQFDIDSLALANGTPVTHTSGSDVVTNLIHYDGAFLDEETYTRLETK